MKKYKLDTIEEAIEEIRKGNFIIVVDDEDRENEGDFIIAAECITPDKINFMETHGRGLVCASITYERCEELDLPMMVANNTSVHATPFTVSIDLLTHGCTSGISAYDRAQTILALTRSETKPEDFGRPGHVFPLRAQSKGVLRRAGHTEAAIDFARLAGLYPAGALVEIKKEDGEMARLPELMEMAQEFDLKIVSVADLIKYEFMWCCTNN
jgi:3,4-dihydroxy 2-butanone 4-phosphate synthase/GTP cyclohydrolase II